MPQEFNGSLQLKQEIPCHLPCTRDLEAARRKSLWFLQELAVWIFFMLVERQYMVIRSNPPHIITALIDNFSDEAYRQTAKESKKAGDQNPPPVALEGSHKSSLTLSQHIPILQPPSTGISAGNMPAVLVSDGRGGQNSQERFPEIHPAQQPRGDSNRHAHTHSKHVRSARPQSDSIFSSFFNS